MTTQQAVDAFDVSVKQEDIEGSRCPWHVHNELRDRGPVVTYERHGSDKPVFGITGHEDVVTGLQEARFSKDPDAALKIFGDVESAKRAGFVLTGSGSKHLLNSDPPDHTRLRRLVARAFSPRRIQQLAPRIDEVVNGLLDDLQDKPEADLVDGFAYQLSITMICELIGVPSDRRAEFRKWSVAATTPPKGDASENMKAAATLHGFLGEHIAKRRGELQGLEEKDAPDVLSAMILAKENDDSLSDSELVGMAFLLLIAGHETTVGLISSMALGLAERPDQRELLLQDPDLVENAVEEFLRYDGPVQRSTFRVATEDVVIADTLIPEGSLVSMHIGGANHDPEVFENPDEIDVTRNIERHVAFGQGVHFCLGAPLARLEAQIAIGTLLKRFPRYELAAAPEDLEYQPTVVRALVSLPVRLSA